LTGGFQTSHGIGRVIRDGSCDAVTIARPLLANPDLPLALLEGLNGPRQVKCTYCNKCLLHVIEHPLGCYDQSRFETGEFTQAAPACMLRDFFELFYVSPEPPIL